MRRAGPILLVDDDADIRGSLGLLLQLEGYDVVEARSGNQALALLQTGTSPSLIVLDLWMPDGDGWYLGATLRRLEELRTVPVLIITGAPSPSAESMGVGLLRKPVSRTRLLAFAATYCARQPTL